MTSRLYYVEDMEHGWTWVQADSAKDAAATVAGPACTVTFEQSTKHKGYPVEWFEIRDASGALVDHYQITDERYLPGADEPEPEQQAMSMEFRA